MKRLLLSILCVLIVSGLSAAVHAAENSVPLSRSQITLTFAPLVKQATPAVVNIYAQRYVQQRVGSPLLTDPFFQHFFNGMAPGGMLRKRIENSLGSGVIVRADGVIVTSNHVIRDADEIRVVLSDKREFDAKIVTTDDKADLAILRIDTKGEALPYLELKDSDDAQVGDLVLAIGNPFGVGQTVTSGIISAVARSAVGSTDLDYFIQTDAAINPGNSGGALITMDGRLVGINAVIYSKDGGNLGIGFAVPSNMVRVVLNAVAQGEKSVVRPWLGIDGQEVTPDIAASLNMPQPTGVLVKAISPASQAGKAGLQVGDVITGVNNHTVDDVETFHYRIATLPINTVADLDVLHKGQRSHVHVNLIAPPEVPSRDKTTVTGRNPFAGATIQNISPAVLADMKGLTIDQGVVITEVKDGTPAASIGLQAGDVILGINKTKTPSVKSVMAELDRANRGWQIAIQRQGDTISVMVGG